MTIRNESYSPAAFFTVQGPRALGMANPGDESSGEITPKIQLESCVARGQATLVQAIEGLPFWLTWYQGFLATTEYLAEVSGRSELSKGEAVRITLTHVTASMDAGLLRLEDSESLLAGFDIETIPLPPEPLN
ncbi:MAG: hypothetical protein ACC628_16880 [Pirellulaceae bacterium]